MSRRALELLSTIGLLDNADRTVDLNQFSEAQLKSQLAYYVQKRLDAVDLELVESKCNSGMSVLVSSISGRTAVQSLLPSAVVFEGLFVDDLLYKLHRDNDSIGKAYNESLGFAEGAGVQRWRIANALAFFEHLAPLIREGMIIILPLAELHKPPKELPMRVSDDWFASEVPATVHDFVHQHARISELRPGPNGKGLLVMKEPPTTPGRGIAVEFSSDDTVTEQASYLLYQTRLLEKKSEQNYVLSQELPWDKPPSQPEYDAWVYQSINQAIAQRLKRIAKEMRIADLAGASYMTESPFEAQLCGKLGMKGVGDGLPANAVGFLAANEPNLRIESADAVRRLRTDNPKLFQRFHQTLMAASEQLNGSGDFEVKAKRILEKDLMPQVHEIEKAATKLWTGAVGSGIAAAGTISLAMLTGPALPMASVLALGAVGTAITGGQTLASAAEYIAARKTPAFVWKEILTRSKK